MKYFNVFYLSILVVAGVLYFFLVGNSSKSEISFFGFSESTETKINYNYPVIVDRLLITPGEKITKGDTLMHLIRRSSKETLSSETYKIAEIKANKNIWVEKKENEIEELKLLQSLTVKELDIEIAQLEGEIEFKSSVADKLKSVTLSQPDYEPLQDKLDQLKLKKSSEIEIYNKQIEHINGEIISGKNPYRPQLKELEAEIAFQESQKEIQIFLTAPSDGLIGSINCKEKEHIQSFETLLTIYEPHSGLIRGYVHEDLTLEVNIDDQLEVSSIKDESISYPGKVVGLGSRIIEIPTRLRKQPTIKSYGREVLVQIGIDNKFLQKEKVSLIRHNQ